MKEAEIKAKELVEKFKKARNKEKQYYIIPITDDAIPLAIICVEEIIKFHNTEFWQEVLNHLKEM